MQLSKKKKKKKEEARLLTAQAQDLPKIGNNQLGVKLLQLI